MWAFILAILIEICTIVGTMLYIFANMMSDATGRGINPWPIFIGGNLLALLVASSHWWPNIGW